MADNCRKRPQRARKEKGQKPTRRSTRLNPEPSVHFRQQSPLMAKTTTQSDTSQPDSSKRLREAEELPANIAVGPFPKRPRASPTNFSDTSPANREAEFPTEARINPIDRWRRGPVWPNKYSEPYTMSDLLTPNRFMPSHGASWAVLNDQIPREEGSASYLGSRYKLLLEAKGCFMHESDLGITEKSKNMYLALLQAQRTVPPESLFRDDIFKRTCRNIQDGSKGRVVQDISRLIVPSAETLATFGNRTLGPLAESVNEDWFNSIPLTKTYPKPDYSVGFKMEAFSKEQHEKLAPFIGDIINEVSFFMATNYICFPFLTCEVMCSRGDLEIANGQNAHSMTLAVRAMVKLFQLAGREEEIDREILAFSVSHNHESVQIFGHYPVLNRYDRHATYYCHPIRKFFIADLDGKEKWTAYKFIRNVYEMWMPTHLNRLRSVIDALPCDIGVEDTLLSGS
ncbi:hypothetical protein K505DRAFT_419475 [Melanomma pulvis-pyrius CBS 109.77]|uniref:DUF7924 domain-containing protein n=1 Tax=Melanomma pulvis-pyrius CBS 109.77 TaxID=1314802 RepID=A0A6A6X3Z4_9PLEO|nr:hypothetical protein K505DRAFT_419475 [Melanomma pulvis-pyrius CBS 109.77]